MWPGKYLQHFPDQIHGLSNLQRPWIRQTLYMVNHVQKYAPVTTDIDDSLVSSTEQKQMGFSYRVISHANGEEGTARERVT